jgi:hypothetical protein
MISVWRIADKFFIVLLKYDLKKNRASLIDTNMLSEKLKSNKKNGIFGLYFPSM